MYETIEILPISLEKLTSRLNVYRKKKKKKQRDPNKKKKTMSGPTPCKHHQNCATDNPEPYLDDDLSWNEDIDMKSEKGKTKKVVS